MIPTHEAIEEIEVGEDEDLETPATLITLEVTDVAFFGTALGRLGEVLARRDALCSPSVVVMPCRAQVC